LKDRMGSRTDPGRPPRVRYSGIRCRSRPQYRSDLGWILGVAFLGTLTRSARPAQGFTSIRCCSALSGFFPTRPRGDVQLPSARGCYQLAPQRICTSFPGSMPGTRRVGAGIAPLHLSRNRTSGPRIRLFGSMCQRGNMSCPDACTWALSSFHRVASDTSRSSNQAGG
jgi:hypothetical protein